MQQIETVLRAADAVLLRKSKLDSAIGDGVADLQNLILAQLETERAFRRMEAAAAIGEPAADLPKAKKAAADARTALEQAALKLGGYRQAVGEMGGALVEAYEALGSAIPEQNRRLISAFADEWRTAVELFSPVLARRAAIERLVGETLNLPEPAADPTVGPLEAKAEEAKREYTAAKARLGSMSNLDAPTEAAEKAKVVQLRTEYETLSRKLEEKQKQGVAVDLGETTRAHETLAALHAGIRSVASMKAIAERQLKPGSYRDPHAVFKVVTDRLETRGIAKGTLVIAATFEPGRLDQLIELEQARPVLDRDQIPGVTIAALKADQIAATARAQEEAASEARLRGNTGEQTTRRPDLEAERNYRPSKAELDKAAAEQALIDAHVPLETTGGCSDIVTTGLPMTLPEAGQ
jgi:hypothetical protein